MTGTKLALTIAGVAIGVGLLIKVARAAKQDTPYGDLPPTPSNLPSNTPPERTDDNDTQAQSGVFGRFNWSIQGRPGQTPYWHWAADEIDGAAAREGSANDYDDAHSQLTSWLESFGA